jgi:hypothetical protein
LRLVFTGRGIEVGYIESLSRARVSNVSHESTGGSEAAQASKVHWFAFRNVWGAGFAKVNV